MCHIASGDRWAGAEAQVATLLRHLARRPDLHLAAILLNEGRLAQEVRACGVTVAVIPESRNGFFTILQQATNYLRGRDVKVLHSHRYKENLLAALLARRLGVTVVVRTQHGAPEPFHGIRDLRQQFVQALDGMVGRWATDAAIAVSDDLCCRMKPRFGDSKVVKIANGLDVELVRSSLPPAEARRRLGIAENAPVVGTAGRLEPVKRLDLFLKAARHLAAEIPEARFVLAGDGSQKTRLQQMTREFGLADRVLFLGHRDDVYDVLHAFDVLLLTSDHEGLPMLVLEALQLGVPVVARNVGGISEVLQHGVNGILVESSEPEVLAASCVHLLRDDTSRQRIALAGTQTVRERFTVGKTAEQVARLYRSLLQGRLGSRYDLDR